jgi:hypothetical protein
MTQLECWREVEVVDAITARRWPDRVDEDLRHHVSVCAICADVAAVACALHDAHDDAFGDSVVLPPAPAVWLRAQARARAEASREAARPIAVMQALGLASAAGIVSLLIGVVAYWVWARAEWLLVMPTLDASAVPALALVVRGTLLAIGLWLVLAPVAVYLVALDD